MRILHVPHAYAPVRGGAEYYCQRVSQAVSDRGHTVRVAVADLSSPEGFYQFGIGSVGPYREVLGGVEVHRIPYRGLAYRAGRPLTAGTQHLPAGPTTRLLLKTARKRFERRLAHEIESFCPDVVMTLPHLFANVRMVLDIHRRRPFPLVMVPLLHEDDPAWPAEEMAGALALADAVVATTSHEAERLRLAYRVPANRIFLCPGGADLPELPLAGERFPRVLFLGRKVLGKGIPELLTAMRIVWQTNPNAELVIAGSRAPSSRAVDDLLQQLSPDQRSRVRSLYDVSDTERDELLASSACLVLPSRVESFGIVLLEAWAHTTPVITYDLPVFRSLVDEGVDGLLTAPGDPVALAISIRRLLADPSAARRMGEAGRAKVAARFSWHQTGAGFETAYFHAISRR